VSTLGSGKMIVGSVNRKMSAQNTKAHTTLPLLAGPVQIFGRLTHHEIDPDLSSLVVCGTSKYLYGAGEEEAHAPTHSPTTPD